MTEDNRETVEIRFQEVQQLKTVLILGLINFAAISGLIVYLINGGH